MAIETGGRRWRPVEKTLLVATYVVLGASGVLLATIEAFLIPQRIFGGIEGLSVVIALIGNFVATSIGGIGARSFGVALTPVIWWFLAFGFITLYAPGGDVIIAGKLSADPGVVTVAPVTLIFGVFGGGLGLVATAYYTKRVNRPTPDE